MSDFLYVGVFLKQLWLFIGGGVWIIQQFAVEHPVGEVIEFQFNLQWSGNFPYIRNYSFLHLWYCSCLLRKVTLVWENLWLSLIIIFMIMIFHKLNILSIRQSFSVNQQSLMNYINPLLLSNQDSTWQRSCPPSILEANIHNDNYWLHFINVSISQFSCFVFNQSWNSRCNRRNTSAARGMPGSLGIVRDFTRLTCYLCMCICRFLL